jgi:hypothetical protein
MRSRLLPIAVLMCAGLVAITPSSASAWGFEAHKYIMRRATDLLPPELKPVFERHREEIVGRVTDPDLWRSVGWPEDPNHFLDFGVKEYGAYPFAELPREWGAALEKFGRATLERNGTLPWRLQEMAGNLRRGFDGMARNNSYSLTDIVLFSAVAGHYVQDAHQPLHATDNYDGGQTGQSGVHARFERDLFERYQSRLTIIPAPPRGVTNARDFAFETLLASFKLVDPLLAADKKAIAGKEAYDDAYFEAFFVGSKAILEQRLSGAITATASIIIGAWEQAGKPAIKLDVPRPVQRVKPAR